MNRLPHLSALLPLAVLLTFFITGLVLIAQSPKIKTVGLIRIAPASEDVILGRQELGQRKGERSAEPDHLKLRFEDGKWQIYNIAKHLRVDAQTDTHGTLYLKRRNLQPGDIISVAENEIEVVKADTDSLTLFSRAGSRSVHWREGKLQFQDEPVFEGHFTLRKRTASRVRRIIRHTFGIKDENEIRLFSIGGGVNTPDRWRLDRKNADAYFPPDTAAVYHYRGKFRLGPGRTGIPIYLTRGGETLRFSQVPLPLNGEWGKVERLIVGRTYYRIKSDGDALLMIPGRGADMFPADEILPDPRTPNIERTFTKPFSPGWNLSFPTWLRDNLSALFLSLFIGTALTLYLYRREKNIRKYRHVETPFTDIIASFAPSSVFIPLTLRMWHTREGIDLFVLMGLTWLSWTWGTLCLHRNHKLEGGVNRLWCRALFLAGTGVIVLTQLAAGADSTRWLDFARKHMLTLTLFGWCVPLFSMAVPGSLTGLWIQFCTGLHRVRILLTACGIGLLVLQLGFGSERGLGPIQPAELGKFLLVMVAAFIGKDLLELRSMNAGELPHLLMGFLKTFFLVIFAVITVAAGVRDFSPILIMTVFMLVWAWEIAPHPWELEGGKPPERAFAKPLLKGAVILLILTIGLTAASFYRHPESIPDGLPQKDRFMVWADPEHHTQTGEQVLKAVRLAGFGGWTGGTGRLFGRNSREIMHLPVVQNDFIGSFVLYKFGGWMGMLLALIQLAYVSALFEAAGISLEWAKENGYRQRWAGRIMNLALYGLAWMHIIHWTIAWANALGLMPVMGQPMTWISAANSHLIFLGLPALFLGVIICGDMESSCRIRVRKAVSG